MVNDNRHYEHVDAFVLNTTVCAELQYCANGLIEDGVLL